MMNKIKFFTATAVVLAIFGCGFFTKKIEEKVNEKVEEQVKESERKIDSVLNANNPDSLKINIDSLLESSGKNIDSIKMYLDSLNLKQKK